MTDKRITPDDFEQAAKDLGVPVAAIRAVTDVESRGSGFMPDGRPVILYERHIMRRQLVKNGREDQARHYAMTAADIVNATPGGYQGGAGEWDRLARAIEIHRQSALESASWGLFQIMGFHWKLLGYSSVQEFVNAMYRGEGAQLDAFVRFIKANPNLLKALKAHDWAAFAKGFNGPSYETNRYDSRLAAAFDKFNKQEAA